MSLGRQRDLFLSEPDPELFEDQPAVAGRNDPEKVRLQLKALLEQAQNAKSTPWPERDASMWQIAFPQLTNWLPPDEAAQPRFTFAQEMQRLARVA